MCTAGSPAARETKTRRQMSKGAERRLHELRATSRHLDVPVGDVDAVEVVDGRADVPHDLRRLWEGKRGKKNTVSNRQQSQKPGERPATLSASMCCVLRCVQGPSGGSPFSVKAWSPFAWMRLNSSPPSMLSDTQRHQHESNMGWTFRPRIVSTEETKTATKGASYHSMTISRHFFP